MIYVTIFGYIAGNPDKIFRGVAGDATICGDPGGVAQDYPYTYFYQPISSLGKRVCVKTCPAYSDNKLAAAECYPGHTVSCTYDLEISENGTDFTVNGGSYSGQLDASFIKFIGYGSSPTLDRICMPSTAVLNNALSSIIDSMTSSLQSG